MKTFRVFRNPLSGQIEAVKQGHSVPAALLTLIGSSWIWAFAKGAPDLAWRLLAVTIIGILLLAVPPFFLCWLAFAIEMGRIGNDQIEKALKKRGFVPVGEVTAADTDQALAQHFA